MTPEANSLTRIAAGLRSGELRAPAFLDGLESRFSRREPEVLAFLPEPGRFSRLRRELGELEKRHPDPASRPPLYGVPIGIKDIYHVEGFTTRAGSRLPPELLRGPEAPCVRALKEAGALILGKTVTTEFAYFAPGPTRNPHDPGRTPGGSSSGSAAAVGAGLCPLALGTQTIGSIIRPASYCAAAGFKPSYGRVSLEGIIPLSPTADHVGWFTADVESIESAASVLCGGWSKGSEVPPLVIGIPTGAYMEKASAEGRKHFAAACARLAENGVEVREADLLPDFESIVEDHNDLVAGEAAEVHREWFSQHPSLYHEQTAALIVKGRSVGQERLERCRRRAGEFRERLTGAMRDAGLSGVAAPSAVGPAPRGLAGTGSPAMNLPWTNAGLPVVGLPSGTVDGLPMGLQLVGFFNKDEHLLRLAQKVAALLGPAL